MRKNNANVTHAGIDRGSIPIKRRETSFCWLYNLDKIYVLHRAVRSFYQLHTVKTRVFAEMFKFNTPRGSMLVAIETHTKTNGFHD